MFKVIKKFSLPFIAGVLFAIICFITINAAMEPVSKSEYCGTRCHEMDHSYQSWKLSAHGANKNGLRAECIDCHLPPKEKYFTHIIVKAYQGTKEIYKHYFGEKYDEEKIRGEVLEHFKDKTCLYCHKDLLAKPDSEVAKQAHIEALRPKDDTKYKCVECHKGTGHNRGTTKPSISK